MKAGSESTLRNSTHLSSSRAAVQYSAVFRSRLQRDLLVLKEIKRSAINIGRSMLDVRCSTFILITVWTRIFTLTTLE